MMTDETNSKPKLITHNPTKSRILPLPDLTNDDNVSVHWDSDEPCQHDYLGPLFYCGRYLGTAIIPESDGRCGPDSGAQCPSCKRLRDEPGTKIEMLKRLYPAFRNNEVKVKKNNETSVVISGEDIGIGLFRRHYGNLTDLFKELKKYERKPKEDKEEDDRDILLDELMATNVGMNIALSIQRVTPPTTRQWDEMINFLVELINDRSVVVEGVSDRTVAESVLRNNYFDVEDTVDCITDHESDLNEFVEKEKKLLMEKEKAVEEANAKRARLTEEAYCDGLQVVKSIDFLNGLDFEPLWSPFSSSSSASASSLEKLSSRTPPEVIIKNGHRMVWVPKDDKDPTRCFICTSQVPSVTGGSYQCQFCRICEGCIQSMANESQPQQSPCIPCPKKDDESFHFRRPLTAMTCPGVLNGGHLHHHPLEFNPHRYMNAVCDIEGEGCHGEDGRCIVWSCHLCEFDVCLRCASQPVPENYSRKRNKIVDNSEIQEDDAVRDFMSMVSLFDLGEEEEVENGIGEEKEGDDNEEEEEEEELAKPFFDHEAARKTVAARWEGACGDLEPPKSPSIILGVGAVGSPQETSPTFHDRTRENEPKNLTTPADGKLSNEAEDALILFKHSQPTDVAAADVTHVEDLLRRVATPLSRDSSLSYATLLDAISAGKLGIAGSMLLSRAYAPVCTPCDDGPNEESKDEQVNCWCGDPINSSTSPSGAVGCLGGHAMHASCAADLLLGGGKCPTCRQTLFFSRVAGTEVKAAAEFAKKEIERVRREEEDRVRSELKELENLGLDVTFQMGDVVLVSPDRKECEKVQTSDTISGGWHEEMSTSCGLEGKVEEVILDADAFGADDDTTVISIRVVSRGRHKFQSVRLVDDYICEECNSSRPRQRRCIQCNICEMCCRRTLRACKNRTHEWCWNPGLLTLLRRSNRESGIGIAGDNDATDAENHILKLRGELVSIKAAREAVKKETDRVISGLLPLKQLSRNLSSGSKSAVWEMASSGTVQKSEWVRARHFLLLARQWGNSEEIKAKRDMLYDAVREGNLDSVARIVRRHNAAKTLDDAKWAEAIKETAEYVVQPFAAVDLRAFPSMMSPRTGFTLSPQATFRSKREILDDVGSLWLEVTAENVDVDEERVKGTVDGTNENPPPPQGWLRVRPNGDGSAAIVRRSESSMKCFGCGDDLVPFISARELYVSVNKDEVQEGDTVLVAATLERVRVTSCDGDRIYCSFSNVGIDSTGCTVEDAEGSKEKMLSSSVWYRASDLVKPNTNEKTYEIDELVSVNNRLRSRHELFLNFSGDERLARKAWKDAADQCSEQDIFPSCARGHVFHARCFQEALVSGSRCPAPGCTEQLFFPSVTRVRNDDDSCCASRNNTEEMAALQVASELSGHAELLEARNTEGVIAAGSRDLTLSGINNLKMCPVCCAGPLFNQECSDMQAHHGQCAVAALRNDSRNCTPDGLYSASGSEIAARMTLVSATKSVADLLPRCPTHKVIVMFNGCMACGHLFTDTSWDDMPKWNPNARLFLELDKKRRNAARLLTEQVRTEAAMLQFERDALWEAEEKDGMYSEKGGMETIIEPPVSSGN